MHVFVPERGVNSGEAAKETRTVFCSLVGGNAEGSAKPEVESTYCRQRMNVAIRIPCTGLTRAQFGLRDVDRHAYLQ